MNSHTRQAARQWTLAQPVVSAFIASLVRDFRDRDDVLQETAVAVLESFDRYDTSRSFVGWAIGIARNQVGLYLRRRGRDRHVFDPDAVELLADAFQRLEPEETRQLDHLRDCVKLLAGRSRKICELRYRQDLKPASIAPLVEMTANSVAKALQRIREQLRECINLKSAAEAG